MNQFILLSAFLCQPSCYNQIFPALRRSPLASLLGSYVYQLPLATSTAINPNSLLFVGTYLSPLPEQEMVFLIQNKTFKLSSISNVLSFFWFGQISFRWCAHQIRIWPAKKVKVEKESLRETVTILIEPKSCFPRRNEWQCFLHFYSTWNH